MSGQRGPQPAPGVRGAGSRVPEIAAGPDDREQMRELYRATGAAAFGLALRVLHRRGAAEDVVREGYRRVRAAQWIVDDDPIADDYASPPIESHSAAPASGSPAVESENQFRTDQSSRPDLGTPWGRSAFAASGPRSDLVDYTNGSLDVTFGRGVIYTPDGSRLVDQAEPERPAPECTEPDQIPSSDGTRDPYSESTEPDLDTPSIPADQSWLLAQIHRLAIQRLRLDRRGDDIPWLAAAARLGFEDPLDSRCEVFVLAYYGGRTYRAISRELGLRVPMVTRLLAESIERLAEQRIDRWTAQQQWSPPGSVLSLADAYALDAVAELEHHHIESKLTPNSVSQFATRVRGVHEVLALLAADDQHTPPRNLETRILADLGTDAPPRRGHWTTRPPWLRRFGVQPDG
ncbi:hypothetical protein ACFWU5_14390 [Nocardia sp. NPDC058640]|uniref:RskA family anti-sigma factor n=1 Tax=Nocardia sp. NPDC058640 TaxID=3346571 RepID=UPI00366431FE